MGSAAEAAPSQSLELRIEPWSPWPRRGFGLQMPQLSIISDLHRPPRVTGEASQPESKEKAKSIQYCRLKDEPS